MEFNGKKADIVFTIKAVESIPCDLRGQVLGFDGSGVQVSEPIETPWPMPWVTAEITKYASGEIEMQKEDTFRIYNPEEPDQYVFVSVERFYPAFTRHAATEKRKGGINSIPAVTCAERDRFRFPFPRLFEPAAGKRTKRSYKRGRRGKVQMLKLIVTLKQAPKSNMVSMQEGTNIVVRNPEDAMLTFDDCNALELAMTLKDAMGDDVHITTLSFGNDKTEEILRESLALGVDRAILVNDGQMRGSDTLATARALAAAGRKIGDFVAVLTGHASMDGRTGFVGPMLAEELHLPYLTNVCEFEKHGRRLTVKRDLGSVIETVDSGCPAVLSNLKKKYSLRVMSIAGIRAAMKMEIERWDLEDIGFDPAKVGLSAAGVVIDKIRPSKKERLQIQMFFDQYKDGDFDDILREIQRIK